MDMENFSTLMEHFILVSFMKIIFVDLEFHKAGFINMKVSGKMEKCMEMESVPGGMTWDKLSDHTQVSIKKG